MQTLVLRNLKTQQTLLEVSPALIPCRGDTVILAGEHYRAERTTHEFEEIAQIDFGFGQQKKYHNKVTVDLVPVALRVTRQEGKTENDE